MLLRSWKSPGILCDQVSVNPAYSRISRSMMATVCGRLYPVDMTRVNEYGQAFDDSGSSDPKNKKKTQ